jgi:hypothetical protein
MQAPSIPQPAQATPPADYWFMHQGPVTNTPGQATFVDSSVVHPGTDTTSPVVPRAAAPTPEEEALIAEHHADVSMSAAYGHMKVLKTPEQLAEDARAAAAAAKPEVTPEKQAAIMNLANTDGQDVATLARRAHEEIDRADDGTVEIRLH